MARVLKGFRLNFQSQQIMGQYENKKVRRRKQIARQHLCQKFADRAVGVVDFAKYSSYLV